MYGVDTEKEITPLMVRDAVLQCFFEAHCTDTGLDIEKDEVLGKSYCYRKVKEVFEKMGSDFEHPTKKDLIAVMQGLLEFSKNFRDPSVIKKHYDDIMVLVNKLQ